MENYRPAALINPEAKLSIKYLQTKSKNTLLITKLVSSRQCKFCAVHTINKYITAYKYTWGQNSNDHLAKLTSLHDRSPKHTRNRKSISVHNEGEDIYR